MNMDSVQLNKFLNKKVSVSTQDVFFLRRERKEANLTFIGILNRIDGDFIVLVKPNGLDTLIKIKFIVKIIEIVDVWRN